MAEAEAKINEDLVKLQTAGGTILDIKEINKDSGSIVLVVRYDMPNVGFNDKKKPSEIKG